MQCAAGVRYAWRRAFRCDRMYARRRAFCYDRDMNARQPFHILAYFHAAGFIYFSIVTFSLTRAQNSTTIEQSGQLHFAALDVRCISS